MTKKYHQPNLEQRSQIATLKKAGFSNNYIAQTIGAHKCTIGRQLRCNGSSKGSCNAANALCMLTTSDKPRKILFNRPMKNLVNEKIQNYQWSPEQINGWRQVKGIAMVSHQTIYPYIYDDMKNDGILYQNLRTRHKKRKNRTHRKTRRGAHRSQSTY